MVPVVELSALSLYKYFSKCSVLFFISCWLNGSPNINIAVELMDQRFFYEI